MVSAQESGIGGWLLLFAIGQVLQAAVSAWQVPGIWHALVGPSAVVAQRSFPAYPLLVVQELVSMTLRAVLYAGVTDLLFAARFHDAFHAYRVANGLSVTATDAAHVHSQFATIRLILYAAI
jgi:hypothetical protein